MGIMIYVKDIYNILDLFIVIIGSIEFSLFLQGIHPGEKVFGALRIARFLRLVNIASRWTGLGTLLSTIKRTLKDLRSFSILMVILLVTYSLIGQELFAWRVKFDMNNIPIKEPLENKDLEGDFPLANFNTFNEALFSVFIVLANDEWVNIMADHYRAESGIASVPFFMSLLFLGQYILLNLFLAILLENFDEDNLEIYSNKIDDGRSSNKSLK
jgi:voltage-dependent calcium channel L type alpha-1D